MAIARFEEDPMFETNLIRWRGSLNPVGDKVKSVADRICRNARAAARADANEASAAANALRDKRFSKNTRRQYLEKAALAYSLRKHADLIYAAMISESDGNKGIVAAGHAAGAAIEFGGSDNVISVENVPLRYDPLFTLRRAIE